MKVGPHHSRGERFTSISSGGSHVCGLRQDGTAVCRMGDGPNFGQASSPEGERFVSLSSGWVHTCGLRQDGTVACWGAETKYLGNVFLPPDQHFVSISAGDRHTCGLREDGTAVCRGDDEFGQSSPPEDRHFESLSSGTYHTCGLLADGAALCWGTEEVPPYSPNSEWVLAYGHASPPVGERFVSLSSGEIHTCGLRSDGTVECWGLDDRRVLRGHGQASPPHAERFAAMSSGQFHTCGLRKDGTVVCWGAGLADRSSPFESVTFVAPDRRLTAVPGPDERYKAITAGEDHTCALALDGAVYCWGANSRGQSNAPVDERFTSITGHHDVTCGLRADGTAVCWGDRTQSPWSPLPGVAFKAVTTGVGILPDGTVKRWRDQPDAYTPAGRFDSITNGRGYNSFRCGLRDDGSVECWNEERKLSSGPEDVTFTSISSKYEFACGLDNAGTPHCWRVHGVAVNFGQWSPPADEVFKVITTGSVHACGLRLDGSAVCWGNDYRGKTSPPAELVFTSLASGAKHTCGILTDGTLACWGGNDHGQSSPPGRKPAIE